MTDASSQTLTGSRIGRFFTPLALSWFFMGFEGVISVKVLSLHPEPDLNNAAFLVVLGIAMLIESPIVDLLSSATALAKNRQHYLRLRAFTLALCGLVTAVQALVAFTPLYDILTLRILDVDPRTAEISRFPLQIMLIWSALVAWRRFRQGVLIRNGVTLPISWGTVGRIVALVATGFGLSALDLGLNGIDIAALGLLASVGSECIFVHFASQRLIHEKYSHDDAEPPLTWRALIGFHAPLTGATAVILLSMPMAAAALSRMPNEIVHAAAWNVVGSVMWLFRSITFALPETVLALSREPGAERALLRFCLWVGAALSASMVVLVVTGLDLVLFRDVLGTEAHLLQPARTAFLFAAVSPFLGACLAYVKGMLTAYRLTQARLWAILASIASLAGIFGLLVLFRLEGAYLIAIAFSLSAVVEFVVLSLLWRRGRRRLAEFVP